MWTKTNISRRMDNLGRVMIPKIVRESLGTTTEVTYSILIDKETKQILLTPKEGV